MDHEDRLLDDLVRQVVVLHEAVLAARLHARLGHPEEVKEGAFDALVAARKLEREIKINVLPKIKHVREVLRQSRLEAKAGRMMEAFLLLDGVHNLVDLRDR